MKILVIEDDALLLQGLILAMQSEGYVCDGVSTAHEAALSLASNHYSLVVLDLGLPDEDGLHFLARMRREKFSQPVLILTARDTVDERISGLDTGADDYLEPAPERHPAAGLARRTVPGSNPERVRAALPPDDEGGQSGTPRNSL